MRKLFIVLITLVFVGCAGGQKTLKVYSGMVDAKGKPIYNETTETIELGKSMAIAVQNAPPPVKPCELSFTGEEIAALTEKGESELWRAWGECWDKFHTTNLVKAAQNDETEVAPAIVQRSMRGVSSIETSDASEVENNTAMWARIGSLALGVWGIGLITDGAGSSDTYNVGDIQMSNSGETIGTGGEGAAGLYTGGTAPATTAARGQQLVIGDGNANMQNGSPSSAFAVGDKSPAFESPISNNAPNFSDNDANNNDSRLF